MKTTGKDKSELIDGILRDAREEAESIISGAEKTAGDKLQSRAMQLKAIEREMLKNIEQQTGIIEKTGQSAVSVEKKRTGLRIREELINKVIERVRVKIKKLEESSGYPEIIRGWILEAAMGLGEAEAYISSSFKEQEIITDDFLAETEEKYFELTGRRIRFFISDRDPVFAQGIILLSGNNRTAFNNQVPARISRYKTEIQKAIYSEFFA